MSYVQHFAKNPNGRDLVIGDIHGHYTLVKKALADIDFDYNKDRLFSVGDLVDRGPESLTVANMIGLPFFHAVKGNHEDMAIRWFDRQPGSDHCIMPVEDWPMDAGSYAWNGGTWFLELGRYYQEKIVEKFRTLPVAIELETDEGKLGIIHAEVIADNWWYLKQVCAEYVPGKHAKMFKMAIESAMWCRERIHRERECKNIRGVEAVACGHTPLKNVAISDNQIYLDTMGWRPEKNGRFTIMEASDIIRLARDAAKAE